MKIKEYHLKAGYPSAFKDIPGVVIKSLPLQGECTDVFQITVDDKVAEEYKVTEMTRQYLKDGIGSFEFLPDKMDTRVYFEATGGGNGEHWIHCYVKPTGDGHGHRYNIDGTLYQFAWCNHKAAKCVMASELPEEMWYSIRHGTCDFFQPQKEGEWSLDNKDIDIPNLRYEKKDQEQINMFILAKETVENINTIEEFKAFYPRIKGAKTLPRELVLKVIALAKQNPPSVVNGEIGIASIYTSFQYGAILKAWGLL